MTNHMAYWLATEKTRNFSVDWVLILLNKFGSLEEIWTAEENDLLNTPECSALSKEIVKERSSLDIVQYSSIVEHAKSESITILPIINQNYPKSLLNCQKPPRTLFVRGSVDVLKKPGIAIVGTRGPSDYGRQKSRNLGRALTQKGYSVISGLALGVDTMAHTGALEGTGATVAVLASGVANITPKSNQSLAEKIVERGGAIVSEYGIDTPAARYKFVQRNRIIAGLSEASIIIEGAESSGTRHTADFAKKNGRHIFALNPVNRESPLAALPLLLSRQGFELIDTAEQVISFLSKPSSSPEFEQTTLG